MPNVQLHRYSRPSMWRRMSLAAWPGPQDPQVYAKIEVDMSRAVEYCQRQLDQTGVAVSAVHLVIRALALAFKKYPQANAMVRYRRVYTRKRIHIFSQVAIPGRSPDLSGAVLRDVDTKSPLEIAAELKSLAAELRRGTHADSSSTRRRLDRIPSIFYPNALRLLDFLQFTLNLNLSLLGIPRDPFGGAMVTSVGSLGASEAFAPLVPISRAPIVVAVGKVQDRPVARDGQVVVRPMCVLGATFDHRVMDGLLAGKLAKLMTAYLEDPEKHERPS